MSSQSSSPPRNVSSQDRAAAVGHGPWFFFQGKHCLVGGLEPFFSPYIGNNRPNWLTFFRGVETTNQLFSGKHGKPPPAMAQEFIWHMPNWQLRSVKYDHVIMDFFNSVCRHVLIWDISPKPCCFPMDPSTFLGSLWGIILANWGSTLCNMCTTCTTW